MANLEHVKPIAERWLEKFGDRLVEPLTPKTTDGDAAPDPPPVEQAKRFLKEVA